MTFSQIVTLVGILAIVVIPKLISSGILKGKAGTVAQEFSDLVKTAMSTKSQDAQRFTMLLAWRDELLKSQGNDAVVSAINTVLGEAFAKSNPVTAPVVQVASDAAIESLADRLLNVMANRQLKVADAALTAAGVTPTKGA